MKNIELISELSNRLRWEQEETERMLDAFCEVLGDKLASNDIVSLHGLGQFEEKRRTLFSQSEQQQTLSYPS